PSQLSLGLQLRVVQRYPEVDVGAADRRRGEGLVGPSSLDRADREARRVRGVLQHLRLLHQVAPEALLQGLDHARHLPDGTLSTAVGVYHLTPSGQLDEEQSETAA